MVCSMFHAWSNGMTVEAPALVKFLSKIFDPPPFYVYIKVQNSPIMH